MDGWRLKVLMAVSVRMPRGQREKENKLWQQLYTCLKRLQIDHGQTCLLSYMNQFGIQSYGGKNAVETMKRAIHDNPALWNEAHTEDILQAGSGELTVDLSTRFDHEFDKERQIQEPPRLPRPLFLMTLNDMKSWLKNQIILDHWSRGHKGIRVNFKCSSWKPSFWLDEYWEWRPEVMRCISDWDSSDYRGPNNITWFCKELIKRRLQDMGISDPENFFVAKFTERQKRKLCKIR